MQSSFPYTAPIHTEYDPTVLALLRNNTAKPQRSRSPSTSPTATSFVHQPVDPKGTWGAPAMESATETHWKDMEDDLLRMVDSNDQVLAQPHKPNTDAERDSLYALLGGLKLHNQPNRPGFSGNSSGLNTPPSRTGSAGAYRNGDKPMVPPGLGYPPASTPSPVHGHHPADHSCQLCPHNGPNIVPASRFPGSTTTGPSVHTTPIVTAGRSRSSSQNAAPFAGWMGNPLNNEFAPQQQHVPLYQRAGQGRPSLHRPTGSVDRFAVPASASPYHHQHRSGPSTPLKMSPLLASSDLAMLEQVPPSRYIILTNIPTHVSFQSLRLFEDGNVVRAVYAGALRTRGTIIAAYFDIRYAVLAVKDLRQRFVEGRQIEARFCSQTTLDRVAQLEPSFLSYNDGIVLTSNLPSNADLEQLNVRMASLGHVKTVRLVDGPHGASILVTEYFDIRDAVHVCDQLNNLSFHGAYLAVRLHDTRDVQMANLLAATPDSPPSHGRPLMNRAQTTPMLPSGVLAGEDGGNRDEAVSRVKEALFLRREQQRLIEADRTALTKHQVPQGNEIVLWKIAQGIDKRTTLMIRNIPNKFTQQMLLDLVNSTHHGEFDFFYLRMDFRNHCNVGYAFINFIDTASIITFAHKHVGRKWCTSLLEKLQLPSVAEEAAFRSKFGSDKVCRLSYANIQGKTALMEKFRNSSVMEKDPTYRPKIFYSDGPLRGEEEHFPGPTHGGRRSQNHEQSDEHWAGAKSAMTALGLLEAEEELERMEFPGTSPKWT